MRATFSSKLCTVTVLSFATVFGVLILPPLAYGQSIPFPPGTPPSIYSSPFPGPGISNYLLYDAACVKGATDSTKCAEVLKKLEGNDCSSNYDAFNQAATDFSAACADAQLSSLSAQGYMCSNAIVRCQYCSEDDSSYLAFGKSFDCGDSQLSDDEDAFRRISSSTTSALNVYGGAANANVSDFMPPESLRSTAKSLTNCPTIAGSYLRENRDYLKDIRRSVRSQQDELSRAQRKMIEDNQKNAEDTAKLNRTAQNIQSDAAKELKEIKEESKNQTEILKAQIEKTQQAIDKMLQDADMLSLSKMTLQSEYKQNIFKLDVACRTQAMQQVEKIRQALINGMKTGTLRSGGFQGFMSTLATPTRTKLKAIAKKSFENCQSDPNYTQSKKLYEQDLSDKQKLIDTKITESQKQVTHLSEAAKQLQTQGQTDIETKAYERLETLRQKVVQDFQTLDQDRVTLASQNAATFFQNVREVDRISVDLANDQAELDYTQTLFNLAKRSAGASGPVKSEAWPRAMASLGNLHSRARSAVYACCNNGKDGDANRCNLACRAIYDQPNQQDQAGSSWARYNCSGSQGGETAPSIRAPATPPVPPPVPPSSPPKVPKILTPGNTVSILMPTPHSQ